MCQLPTKLFKFEITDQRVLNMEKEKIIDRWKRRADELKLQLHLGSKELQERFEEQKKDIEKWAHETRHKLEDETSVRATNLKIRLEELEVQAALGRAESEDALKEQQKNMSKALEAAREEARQVASDAKNNLGEIAEKADARLDTWYARFDILRLQLKLGAAEASDEWEERKKELNRQIHELEERISEAGKKSSENWQKFKFEMGEAWGHMKKAFAGK